MQNKEKELQKYINLRNKVDHLNKKLTFKGQIKNPFEKLLFPENKEIKLKLNIFSYKLWLGLFIVGMFSLSILLNTSSTQKADSALFGFVNNFKQLISNQITKPYVITIGEFQTFDEAKQRAFELLPRFKQINIKQLPTGTYTFQVQRFASKQKAYSISEEFKEKNFEAVHVRYLPNQ